MMYDFIIDIFHSVWRNGFSLTALGAVIFVILRQRKVKRKLKNLIPMLFSDDSEVKDYVSNQVKIMQNQRVIMRQMGVEGEWNGSTEISKNEDQQSLKRLFSLSQVALSRKGKTKMKNFLTGKKKWLAFLLAVAVNGLNETLGLGIEPETVYNITAGATGYVIVEGVLDFTRSLTDYLKSKGGKQGEYTQSISASEFEG